MAFQIAMYNKQWASQVVQWEKNLPATKETQEIRVQFLVGKIPWRRAWQPTPVSQPGESLGQEPGQATVHVVTESQKQLKRLSTDGR